MYYYNVTCLKPFEDDLMLRFYDPNSEEDIRFSVDSASNLGWLMVDNTTNKLYGTPTQMGDQTIGTYIRAYGAVHSSTYLYAYFYMKRNNGPKVRTL